MYFHFNFYPHIIRIKSPSQYYKTATQQTSIMGAITSPTYLQLHVKSLNTDGTNLPMVTLGKKECCYGVAKRQWSYSEIESCQEPELENVEVFDLAIISDIKHKLKVSRTAWLPWPGPKPSSLQLSSRTWTHGHVYFQNLIKFASIWERTLGGVPKKRKFI